MSAGRLQAAVPLSAKLESGVMVRRRAGCSRGCLTAGSFGRIRSQCTQRTSNPNRMCKAAHLANSENRCASGCPDVRDASTYHDARRACTCRHAPPATQSRRRLCEAKVVATQLLLTSKRSNALQDSGSGCRR